MSLTASKKYSTYNFSSSRPFSFSRALQSVWKKTSSKSFWRNFAHVTSQSNKNNNLTKHSMFKKAALALFSKNSICALEWFSRRKERGGGSLGNVLWVTRKTYWDTLTYIWNVRQYVELKKVVFAAAACRHFCGHFCCTQLGKSDFAFSKPKRHFSSY